MDDPIWTFTRCGETMTIVRRCTPDGLVLVVTDNGVPRSYFFDGIGPLTTFHLELEAALVRNGWSFAAFTPERRTRRDRRQFPARSSEQREHRLRHATGQRSGAPGKLQGDVRGRNKG